MRGKVESGYLNDDETGITPAYAGKSSRRFFARSIYQDHPRLCGEKFLRLVQPFQLLGSPPPMRGKGNNVTFICNTRRITPAYAGKRLTMHSISWRTKDHPRLCGEKLGVCPR